MEKKVVVIDDLTIVRKMIVHIFDWQKLNCKVVGQADNGLQGKKIIEEMSPDILIADARTAGINGLDLAEWMLANFPMAKTILTTANRDFEFARRAIRLKVHAFVIKPVQKEELFQAVQSAVEDLDRRDTDTARQPDNADDPFGLGSDIPFHEELDRSIEVPSGRITIMQELEQFEYMLEHGSIEELKLYTGRLLTRIIAYGDGRKSVIRGLLANVCLAAVQYAYKVTRDEFVLDLSVDRMLDHVYQIANMKEAHAFIWSTISAIKVKTGGGDKDYVPFVKQVIDYINSQYSSNISLASVANQFGYSTSYVSRTIRSATGVTFTDLVARARIEAAKRLLRDGKHKVNEVGEMVGFKEYAYFYQVFKRTEGVSPKEFKNNGKTMHEH